jgi:hypothetical protein
LTRSVGVQGNKKDARDAAGADTKKFTPISTADGQKLADQIGAQFYVECSAKLGDNVKTVFDDAIKAVIRKKEGGKKCVLL